jgi:adenosylcobinamide kinase / adenosylcobinamide-phosphate guanylyltransferase
MRVRLLGTGSADGWPNAFCACASCLAAHREGRLRSPTSALVDGRLLLDCGPETPRAALRHDGGLGQVSQILVTHDHPDHSAPMAMLARFWAGRTEPITVVGPAPVIAAWSSWVGPKDPVSWTVATPGDVLEADGYTVRVLAADHGEVEAVMYDVTAPDGGRLLYATDTGSLSEATLRATQDAGYDLVMMEATFGDRQGPGAPSGDDHLDLRSFADQLVRLRGAGAITATTRVVPVHLSHHSPPDLAERVARWGARLVDDGYEFRTGATDRPGGGVVVEPIAPGAHLPRRTVVLGGARSGKSRAAEQLLTTVPGVTYVATGFVPDGTDPEWSERVAKHRARRPRQWRTLETTDIGAVLRGADGPVLVDCIGMWLTSVMTQSGAWRDADGWRQAVTQHVDALLDAWHAAQVPVIAVTNEVGSGVVPSSTSGRLFRDQLGAVNTRLSMASEQVLLVVAGRTIDLAQSSAPSLSPTGSLAPADHHGPASATTPGPMTAAADLAAVPDPA